MMETITEYWKSILVLAAGSGTFITGLALFGIKRVFKDKAVVENEAVIAGMEVMKANLPSIIDNALEEKIKELDSKAIARNMISSKIDQVKLKKLIELSVSEDEKKEYQLLLDEVIACQNL